MTVTINDLDNIVRFIDAMAERGAIKGSELVHTGEIRERIKSFVEATREEQEQQEAKSELLTEG